MPRAKTTKLYRTFVKGLITEAGYLTYPENASTDELNTVPSPRGSRNRRLGIQEEPNGVPITLPVDSAALTQEFTWRAASNRPDQNFLVQQIGSMVQFFAINDEPLSTHRKSFTIDLTQYMTSTQTPSTVEQTPCSFASGKGYLFIVSEAIEPLCVDYDRTTDTISIVRVVIQIRDFDGLPDGLSNDNEPATLSKEHCYNLKNQGWIAPGST